MYTNKIPASGRWRSNILKSPYDIYYAQVLEVVANNSTSRSYFILTPNPMFSEIMKHSNFDNIIRKKPAYFILKHFLATNIKLFNYYFTVQDRLIKTI